jgi:protoheme IX farnesyltransferase
MSANAPARVDAPVRVAAVDSPAFLARALLLLRDYGELVKTRVTSLVMMSAWCGFYLARIKTGAPTLSWALLPAVLGIGMVAGGTAALNQVMERDLDALMRRTDRRPIPRARLSATHAAVFGVAMTLAGIAYLALATNRLTALLAVATSAAYLFAYTPLKRRSPICTFIGAFPGAMPPVLGWVAARGALGWEPLALFAIVWFWQFPHFHAIAWLYREDYERARIRMLAVADQRATAREILLYSLLLVPISLAPVWLGMAGSIYLVSAAALGAAFFWTGWRLARPTTASPALAKARARQVLQASVFYLPLLFMALMLNAR